MQYEISLLLSPYSDHNQEHRALLEEARELARAGRNPEAFDRCSEIRKPGVAFLKSRLNPLIQNNQIYALDIQPVWGVFAGVAEPSHMVDIKYSDRSVLQELRNIAIDFGERFQQTNVHIINVYDRRPIGVEYGVPTGMIRDVVYQRKLWIQLQNMHFKLNFQRFFELQQLADSAGFSHLTFDYVGGTLLIYSIGTSHQTFVEQTANLLQAFGNRVFRSNTTEDVSLINYGGTDFGATHSYEDARLLMRGPRE